MYCINLRVCDSIYCIDLRRYVRYCIDLQSHTRRDKNTYTQAHCAKAHLSRGAGVATSTAGDNRTIGMGVVAWAILCVIVAEVTLR